MPSPVLLSCLALGALAALAGQSLPPLHVLGHEWSTVATLACAGVALWVGASSGQGDQSRVGAVVHAMEAAALALLGALAVGVAAARVRGCLAWPGLAWLAVTWPPLVLLAAVGGACLSARGWSRSRILLAALALGILDGVHDGLQALWGPRVMDLLVGKPLAFDIREDMTVPLEQVWNRLWLLGVALALLAWEAGRGVRVRVLLAVGMVGITVLFSSHVGVGWGHGALHRHLPREVRTEHVVVRHPMGGFAAIAAPTVAREAEYQWQALVEAMGIEDAGQVRIHLFEDEDDQRRYTTTAAPHVILRRMYLSTWAALDPDVIRHEMVHALTLDTRPSPLLVLSRGALEGPSMAWEDDTTWVPEAHFSQAGAHRSGTLPHAGEFMSLLGFQGVNESNAYEASGSFVGFLILRHGFPAWLDFQRSLDFQEVYGKDVDALDAEWRAFLETVPVDLEQSAQARDTFDPLLWPGYLDEPCPKVGACQPSPWKEGRDRMRVWDWSGALARYQELLKTSPSPRWAFFAATCLVRLDRPQDALDLLEPWRTAPDLARDQRFRVGEARIQALLKLGDWEGLARAFEERRGLLQEGDRSRDREVLEDLLQDPDTREEVARVLLVEDKAGRLLLTRALWASRPDDPRVRWLMATRGFDLAFNRYTMDPGDYRRREVRTWVAFVEENPGSADTLAPDAFTLGRHCARLGDVALARSLGQALATLATSPLWRARGQRLLHEVEWMERRGP